MKYRVTATITEEFGADDRDEVIELMAKFIKNEAKPDHYEYNVEEAKMSDKETSKWIASYETGTPADGILVEAKTFDELLDKLKETPVEVKKQMMEEETDSLTIYYDRER